MANQQRKEMQGRLMMAIRLEVIRKSWSFVINNRITKVIIERFSTILQIILLSIEINYELFEKYTRETIQLFIFQLRFVQCANKRTYNFSA